MMMRRVLLIFLIVVGGSMLSGCVGRAFSILCPYLFDNAGHCFQRAAVFDSDPDLCEEIKQPEEWKKAGSNPPKDKCYLLIAEKTGDSSVCSNIEGGLGSYTREECIQAAAKNQ